METLEEVAERIYPMVSNEYLWHVPIETRKIFIKGAKWQQERSYSEEEVLDITKQAYAMGRSNYTIEAFNNWFKQFKKK